MPDSHSPTNTVTSSQLLARGISVIEAMARNEQPVGVGELAREVGLPKSTVQRILHTLNEVGWVECVAEPMTRWTMTDRMSRLAGALPRHPDLRSAAMPHLRWLGDITQEAIHLTTLDRSHWATVLIERIDSTHPVRTFNELGTVAPLHAGAAGKAILAALRDDEVDDVIRRGLPSVTSGTIVSEAELRTNVAQIRRDGYSVSRGEWRTGAHAIGAAVVDGNGAPVAALVISMPDARFTEEGVPEWGRLVKEASRRAAADWLRT